MSAIRQFVMKEPLFDNHDHQHGFSKLAQRKDDLNYRDLLGYAPADVSTALGVGRQGRPDISTDEGFFEIWSFVRTTGYGQATELACRQVLGLEFTLKNVPKINDALRRLFKGKSAQQVYEEIYEMAGVRWVVNDECWDSPTLMENLTGKEHPPFFRHALRYDRVLTMTSRGDVHAFEKALGRSIHRLRDLDDALDAYTEKAKQGGKLACMKSAMPYSRRLDFENSSYAEAERVFEAIMQGRYAEPKPLHDYLFHRFVQRAAEFGLPVQLHTGYLAGNWGDPTQGDPTPLVPVLARYRNVRFDLFHAGWPYCEVLGAIAKAFPNVYPDLCWAWSMNPAQIERALEEWLAAVPHNKIFGFGADTGLPFPMVGYAMQARNGIANVLERKVASGEYDLKTARQVAQRIMHQNAREFYATD